MEIQPPTPAATGDAVDLSGEQSGTTQANQTCAEPRAQQITSWWIDQTNDHTGPSGDMH